MKCKGFANFYGSERNIPTFKNAIEGNWDTVYLFVTTLMATSEKRT